MSKTSSKLLNLCIIIAAFALFIYLYHRFTATNDNVQNSGQLDVSGDNLSSNEYLSNSDNGVEYSVVNAQNNDEKAFLDATSTNGELNSTPGSNSIVGSGLNGTENANRNTSNVANSSCFPKDQLTAAELLPQNKATTWAEVNPPASGTLKDRNFLQAGHHVGINTVGQTLRNANMQLRSEPPNPQVAVSPWLQSTIDPDMNRKPLEIGGCA